MPRCEISIKEEAHCSRSILPMSTRVDDLEVRVSSTSFRVDVNETSEWAWKTVSHHCVTLFWIAVVRPVVWLHTALCLLLVRGWCLVDVQYCLDWQEFKLQLFWTDWNISLAGLRCFQCIPKPPRWSDVNNLFSFMQAFWFLSAKQCGHKKPIRKLV